MKDYFRKFSFLVEYYPIELFTLEMLAIILIRPELKLLVFLVLGLGFTIGVSEGIKLFTMERRPKTALERKFYRNTFKLNRRSFPSTHSASVSFFAFLLWGTPLFIPLFIFALIVMYSRLYIKSHYPRDIIVGALIGAVIGYAISAL